ncbi:MAG: hypothetical protein OEU32_12695, partial [Acidimicrobiia bacterium]|nr:hypothetical protein [Acidimicrobiia bacterium]
MTSSATETAALSTVIDLDRYPLHRLDVADDQGLTARCRRSLAETGLCQLDGFLRPGAVDESVQAVTELLDRSWASNRQHNVYFVEPPAVPLPGDPLGMMQRSAKHAIAYDQLPARLALRAVYESDLMTAFVAAVLGKDRLYRSADPLDALEIAVFEPGEELGWHFDNSEFSVTLMLQPA